MRKLSKINEGLWKDGVNRVKNDEVRNEDKMRSNIDEIEEIDLGDFCPFYISDRNLEINDSLTISFDEYRTYRKQIEKSGWRMPTPEEWKDKVMSHCIIKTDTSDDSTYSATLVSKYDDVETLLFENANKRVTLRYWMERNKDMDEKNHFAKTFEVFLVGKLKDAQFNFDIDDPSKKSYLIRLVKDK